MALKYSEERGKRRKQSCASRSERKATMSRYAAKCEVFSKSFIGRCHPARALARYRRCSTEYRPQCESGIVGSSTGLSSATAAGDHRCLYEVASCPNASPMELP